MRQVGILAAAARYALTHHRARLEEDHANAKAFAAVLANTPGARVELANVETNIVNVDVDVAAETVAAKAHSFGMVLNASGPHRLRAVMHLDVTAEDVMRGAALLARAIAACK